MTNVVTNVITNVITKIAGILRSGSAGLIAVILAVSACTGESEQSVASSAASTVSSSAAPTTAASTTGAPPTSEAAPIIDPDLLPPVLQGLTVRQEGTISLADGSSITTDGAVISGEHHLYRFEAVTGQTLTVSITSVGTNAVFTMYAPDETLLIEAATSFSSPLANGGTYLIVVEPTSGNARYTITFAAG